MNATTKILNKMAANTTKILNKPNETTKILNKSNQTATNKMCIRVTIHGTNKIMAKSNQIRH